MGLGCCSRGALVGRVVSVAARPLTALEVEQAHRRCGGQFHATARLLGCTPETVRMHLDAGVPVHVVRVEVGFSGLVGAGGG